MMRGDKRQFVLNEAHRMKVGQSLTFEGRMIREAFPVHPLFGIYENSYQHLMSNLMGSGYGEFTVEIDGFKDAWTIKRHEGSMKRVYVDPDREHLYKRMPDGELVHLDLLRNG